MRYVLVLLSFVSVSVAFAVQPPTAAKHLAVRGLEQPRMGERYYVMIFSSQNEQKQPRFTHTWVTGIRVLDSKPGSPPIIEHHTISWMPATLKIVPSNVSIEPGINLGLHRTFTDVALANREQIAIWGPYECRPELYRRLLTHKQFMETSQMGYQCVDSVGEAARTRKGCNCVHAVTDMDPGHGRRQYLLLRYGFSAGREIARRFRELDVLVDPDRRHDFLIPALGLQAYPIIRGNTDEIFTPSRTPFIGKR